MGVKDMEGMTVTRADFFVMAKENLEKAQAGCILFGIIVECHDANDARRALCTQKELSDGSDRPTHERERVDERTATALQL